MGKKPEAEPVEEVKTHKKTKYNRFEKFDDPDTANKNTWPSVIHISFRTPSSISATSHTASTNNNSNPTSHNTEKSLGSKSHAQE